MLRRVRTSLRFTKTFGARSLATQCMAVEERKWESYRAFVP
jgi:hypothetical protein